MHEQVLMSEIEITADGGRPHGWAAAEKLRIVEEAPDDLASIFGHGAKDHLIVLRSARFSHFCLSPQKE